LFINTKDDKIFHGRNKFLKIVDVFKRKMRRRITRKKSKFKNLNKQVKSEPKPVKTTDKKAYSGLETFYIEKYKTLFIIFLLVIVFSIGVFGYNYATTGELLQRDVSLKGGVSLTILTNYSDIDMLQTHLEQAYPDSSFNIKQITQRQVTTGMIIEASDVEQEKVIATVKELFVFDNYSVETIGSSLGESFARQMLFALLLAFLFMGFVFHYYFRNYYATFAAIFSASMDLLITAAVVSLLGIRVTAGGIAAFLMLVGYSIDTSILLSTKVLKHDGYVDTNTAIFRAMKTGLTMSFSGLAATGISFFITNNETLKQVMLILVIGLIFDLLTTWVGNVSLLRMYLERKNAK